jgi:hypothetical protein
MTEYEQLCLFKRALIYFLGGAMAGEIFLRRYEMKEIEDMIEALDLFLEDSNPTSILEEIDD